MCKRGHVSASAEHAETSTAWAKTREGGAGHFVPAKDANVAPTASVTTLYRDSGELKSSYMGSSRTGATPKRESACGRTCKRCTTTGASAHMEGGDHEGNGAREPTCVNRPARGHGRSACVAASQQRETLVGLASCVMCHAAARCSGGCAALGRTVPNSASREGERAHVVTASTYKHVPGIFNA